MLDNFLSYLKKGRKRIPHLRESVDFFFIAQLLYVPFLTLFNLSFLIWFPLSIIATYYYALSREPMKKIRHDGIAIGYEYPHPRALDEKVVDISKDLRKSFTIPTYEGSKGIYDLQIKSEPNPHAMIIGESGSGKTNLVLTFLSRSYLKYGIPFLILDWSGAYKNSGINVNIWSVPKTLRINPFELRGMSKERRSGIAAELLQFSLGLTDLQAQRVRETLMTLYDEGILPSISKVHDRILDSIKYEPYREIKLQLTFITNKLRQAFEVFGTEPEEFWDSYDKTCSIVDLEGLTDIEKKLVTYTIMQRIIEEFKVRESTKLHIALDDAYQSLLDYYGKETNITKIVREGRKYGFGLLIATQMLKDLPEPIIANTSMKFILSYHEPMELENVHTMLGMSDIETSLLFRMPKGNCFLFDQNAIQGGKAHPAYIEVDRITKQEMEKLASSIARAEIGGIPVPKQETTLLPKRASDNNSITQGLRIPPVSVYRFLVAMHRTSSNTAEAIKFLKEKRLITSDSTIYGGKKQPSLIERAKDGGYINEEEKLTDNALQVIDPGYLVSKQGARKGGEDHQAIMRRIIEIEQDNGNFAFVLSDKEGFDVGVIVPDKRTKGVWNYGLIRTYEVQTTAIRSEIDRCIEKSKEYNTELIFATNSLKVKKEIGQMAMDRYKVLKISPYPEAQTFRKSLIKTEPESEINQKGQSALGQTPNL
jgi:hypothetical protein